MTTGFNYDAEWQEQASAPSTPASTRWKLFPKSDGFYSLDDLGAALRILTSADIGALGAASALSLALTGTAAAGFLQARAQSSDPAAPATDGWVLFPNAASYLAWRIKNGSDTYTRALIGALTAARSWTTPDVSGVLLVGAVTSTATAAGTTTLTSASTRTQLFTGTLTHTVKMAPANTLVLGWEHLIRNSSTGAVTVQDNAAGALLTLAANQEVLLICTNIGSAAGTWSVQAVTGSGARVNATSPTIVTPTIAKLANLTTDGVLQASGGDGTLSTYKPTLFVQTADVTIANTTTATSIVGTGVGSMTLPANTLTAGKAITFQWKGLVSSAAAPGNVRNNFKLNGAATITSANVAIGNSLVTRLYTIEITIVCRSVGASGVIDIKGRAVLNTSNTAIGSREILLTATTTIDTTATISVDLHWVWDTADVANTVTFTQGTLKQEAA